MNRNYRFSDVNQALPDLLRSLDHAGEEVGSRAGRTKELTHVGITLTHPWRREILLQNRKANIAAQIAETMWVLAGRNDVEFLSHYLPRADQFSDNGETWRAGYGTRLRSWNTMQTTGNVDQLAYVVNLLKQDLGTRQAVMSIWDPAIDTQPGKDIPCNDWLHFLSRNGYLDLHVAIRSNDIIWGWSGINQFEWSALLEIVAKLVGARVGSLHFSTSSLHIYDRHWTKGERISTEPYPLRGPGLESPAFEPLSTELDYFDSIVEQWFRLEYDIRTGNPLVQGYVDNFSEPMLRSWLRVLQWWWSGGVRSDEYLVPLEGTRLREATRVALQPKPRVTVNITGDARPFLEKMLKAATSTGGSPFIRYVINLHNEKHKAYGDSWKRRGEMLGIMANIARKIDRLGGGETADETSADTAIDLFVYLAKYRTWLRETVAPQPNDLAGFKFSDQPEQANHVMRNTELRVVETGSFDYDLQASLSSRFDLLERLVTEGRARIPVVENMLLEAYAHARLLWEREQDEYRGADHD